ncbi:MAG: 50S ribosomal protein L31 type B [Chlamydiae bacterium]|nr:50S ribosomal protein L31 type B [Chlamydiota bacterium]
MKKDTHPKYQEILFVDSSTGQKLVCGSTLQTKERETFEGKEYPVCRVSVSSSSHPFFTGSKQFVDAEGRVDKFRKRYNRGGEKKKEEEQGEEGKDKKEKKQQ